MGAVLRLLCYAKQECRRERIINMAIPKKKKNDVWVKDDDWDGSLKKKKVNRLRHVESKEPATSADNKPLVVTKDKLRSEMQEYGVPKYGRNENRAFLVNPGQGIGLRPLHLEGTAKKKDLGPPKKKKKKKKK